MKDSEIPELVQRAKDGDEEAMERLYHLHNRQIYGLCLRMTSNPTEAEDMTQEAFLQAFRKINTFRGDAAFFSWIYRIATNVVLMRRRKKVHPEVALEDATAPNGVAPGIIKFIKQPDPSRKLVDEMHLHWALDQLPDGFRNVLVMHDIEGYKHKEIAKRTGHSVGNSKSQLHNARHRLRELLTADSHAL